eukprot:1443729-Pyramimonas_sp.AAC.1
MSSAWAVASMSQSATAIYDSQFMCVVYMRGPHAVQCTHLCGAMYPMQALFRGGAALPAGRRNGAQAQMDTYRDARSSPACTVVTSA